MKESGSKVIGFIRNKSCFKNSSEKFFEKIVNGNRILPLVCANKEYRRLGVSFPINSFSTWEVCFASCFHRKCMYFLILSWVSKSILFFFMNLFKVIKFCLEKQIFFFFFLNLYTAYFFMFCSLCNLSKTIPIYVSEYPKKIEPKIITIMQNTISTSF